MSTQPKTWIITGGSRGIGRAVVERVIARGDRVVSLSRGVSSLEFSRPRQVMEIKTDVTEGDSVARAIRAVAEETERPTASKSSAKGTISRVFSALLALLGGAG